jgi:hypothetical protein
MGLLYDISKDYSTEGLTKGAEKEKKNLLPDCLPGRS